MGVEPPVDDGSVGHDRGTDLESSGDRTNPCESVRNVSLIGVGVSPSDDGAVAPQGETVPPSSGDRSDSSEPTGHISLPSVVEPPRDNATPGGRLMLNMLGTMAEYERELIVERVNAGRWTFPLLVRQSSGLATRFLPKGLLAV